MAAAAWAQNNATFSQRLGTLAQRARAALATDERGNLVIFSLPRQRNLRLSRPFGHLEI
jgi:hypothetical protein